MNSASNIRIKQKWCEFIICLYIKQCAHNDYIVLLLIVKYYTDPKLSRTQNTVLKQSIQKDLDN